ncbi:hypothetical protein SDC9_182626 [bioreactor metagenome]|uniref:Uncharacterized protein n=1 Tax=bioreactor metagenome TaxID=1076179 RepID=A0A645H7X8_9ZZZZ
MSYESGKFYKKYINKYNNSDSNNTTRVYI